jgi:fatty acid-binding protein DegV
MVDYARRLHDDGSDAWVVQHVQNPETAQRLIEACKPIFGNDFAFTSEIGPVIGAHVGPGLVGVGGVPKSLLEL